MGQKVIKVPQRVQVENEPNLCSRLATLKISRQLHGTSSDGNDDLPATNSRLLNVIRRLCVLDSMIHGPDR
jgi:hypothetical protein